LKPSRRETRASRPAPPPSAPSSLIAHPDDPEHLKFCYATWISENSPGREKQAALEEAFRLGPLGDIPDIDHWAMEEFFWHGVPGDNWHPIEAYIEYVGDQWSAEEREQFRLWKEARAGFFEIVEVKRETLTLREWDVVNNGPVGEPFPAISLSIGGTRQFRYQRGRLMFTYLAPWRPANNLYCAMGYSMTIARNDVGIREWLLGLRAPDRMAQPLPWRANPGARKEYERSWRQREWQSWFKERLQFPFRAIIPVNRGNQPLEITDILDQTPEMARRMGIYLVSTIADAAVVAGATHVLPLDILSSNWMAIREYQAYRERFGAPPGVRGLPTTMRLDPRRR
ncbi:MAG: hypothetical protein N2556_06515, partial [Anaerolineae bacterium]|nr:hypothetical protein [Anaerolineae bacterium]